VLPDVEVTIDSLKEMAHRVLGESHASLLPRILRIIENTGIQSRRIVRPIEENIVPTGFGHRNNLFIEVSKDLGVKAAQAALDNAGLTAGDIDLIITTSCTGFMIPSLDAHLMATMDFKPKCKRMPITELGCAAGTVGLSRAREFILAHPGQNVLIVAHELASLTYQPADFNMAALVGALLFGDGVTACVVRGDGGASKDGRGLQLDCNESFLFRDSWGYMGFDVRDSGMHLILDKGIPGAVEKQIAPVLLGFLDGQRRSRDDIDFFCLHPGGKKVIEEIARVFELEPDDTRASRDCLAEVGNLSSASILVVLKNIHERYTPAKGDTGMVVGFGPGFCAEMLLGTWVA
jgi:predicted naringenin-chalcone synthase